MVSYAIIALKFFKFLPYRMDELNVYDVEFLHGCLNPTVIVIHKDNDGRHVKSHEINLTIIGAKNMKRHSQRLLQKDKYITVCIPKTPKVFVKID